MNEENSILVFSKYVMQKLKSTITTIWQEISLIKDIH